MNGCLPQREIIEQALAERNVRNLDIHTFTELGSTSQWLREQMTSAEQSRIEGSTSLCVTDWQNAGVGRRGKSWQARPGNITFSVHRTSTLATHKLIGLSLVTGIAVALALRDTLSITVRLKWPNDIIHNDAKLGGLLTEIINHSALRMPAERQSTPAESTTELSNGVLTGIGINVLHDPSVSTLGIGSTSLQAAGVELSPGRRDHLIGVLAAEILSAHQRFETEGWSTFADQWKALDWLAGQSVNIHRESGMEQGVVKGVDHRGALLVEREGKLMSVVGGDVSIRPTV